jgi:hypothetical protein
MRFCKFGVFLLLLPGLALPTLAANAIHKCVIKGTVTFQQDPCPRNAPRQDPTVEQLNLEEKKRREALELTSGVSKSAANPAPAVEPTATPAATPAPTPKLTAPQLPAKEVSPLPARRAAAFSCDGRTYCSQMSSCAEAKYFLANCPGVKMDGDKNGIPCEQQWCNR